ncbi:SMI1/KNR4 family protein [Sphingobacterium sp. LRF_L2]|uniref:SMI1/KNR4 family protein n=1 Tax=Sphingobacterium sp. LRF_L2 TaxID=3369421 RepID=UPI003F605997
MTTIERNEAPKSSEIAEFLRRISFLLPEGFIEFYKQANGADISSEKYYTILWPVTDMIQLNEDYSVEEYAPDFFIFGSDGGDNAFAIYKSTGEIFEMPFIGMSKEEAIFNASTFNEFLILR